MVNWYRPPAVAEKRCSTEISSESGRKPRKNLHINEIINAHFFPCYFGDFIVRAFFGEVISKLLLSAVAFVAWAMTTRSKFIHIWFDYTIMVMAQLFSLDWSCRWIMDNDDDNLSDSLMITNLSHTSTRVSLLINARRRCHWDRSSLPQRLSQRFSAKCMLLITTRNRDGFISRKRIIFYRTTKKKVTDGTILFKLMNQTQGHECAGFFLIKRILLCYFRHKNRLEISPKILKLKNQHKTRKWFLTRFIFFLIFFFFAWSH